MMAIFALVAFPLLMAFAAASDLVTMTISNRLSLALCAGFFVVALASGLPLPAIGMHILAGALVLAATFALFALGWIGGGDAKLAAATALWLGFGSLLDYLLLAAFAGGLLTLALLLVRSVPLPRFALGWEWAARLHHPKTGVPYGIALAFAGLVVYPHSAIWKAAAAF
ncbi:prepilin peptidase [Chelatococcus sp. SYSU_G07232]|uniref:Prepilin peptidase n=1 Tax=Chelatococcus albus TaxID=3047466 RepID=A0ABT7AE45_9HYPH|nr:prepilin peptidase [Chelatococcus sp. SYSU_G07232]MDJ1157647.1 prepilin peptidase [Chelatococcus sp. SYSU_G07232]